MALSPYTKSNPQIAANAQGSARKVPAIGVYGGALALLAVLVFIRQYWPAQLLLVLLLLAVPGAVLLRALRVPGKAVSSFPIYLPCASLAVLTGSGLAVDLCGPLAGIQAPLRPGPLLVAVEIVCGVLLVASRRAPSSVEIPWLSLAQPLKVALPFTLPLVSVWGALRLNNGLASSVAVVALCLCGAVLVVILIYAPRLDPMVLGAVIYSLGLAMMWSFSLRGDLVYGFDIATEYFGFHQTTMTGIWHTAHPGDAYGAMLSLTVLPTTLHALSGVSDLMVFKLVYPALTAFFPVAVFGLARRVVARRWAFMAAAFILVQSPFSEELPAIARQEIALLFFVGLLTVTLDNRLRRKPRWSLAVIFSLGMAVSHYSTTYFTLGLLAVAMFLQFGISWIRPLPRITGVVALSFAATLAGAVIWYGPVTHSSSNLTQFVYEAEVQGFNPLPNQTAGENLVLAYLNGNTQTSIDAGRYAQLAHQYYAADKPYIKPLSDANQPQYVLKNSKAPAPRVKSTIAVNTINDGEVLADQLANILAAAGALCLALRRKTPDAVRQLALLGLATLMFLVVIRFSGTVANAYNQERAFVQSMSILSISLCWMLQCMANWRRRFRRSVAGVCIVALALIFGEMNGLVAVTLGGSVAANLSNSGEDYERFVMSSGELASAHWLGREVEPGQFVYADRYAQLPFIAISGVNRSLMGDVTPETISRSAWVYGSTSNVANGRGRALFNNQIATYVFPARFLEENFNTVYTDGSSEVFHR